MKRFIVLLVLASIFMLAVVGCGSKTATPTDAVKGFLAAIEKNDMEALAKVSAEGTAELVAMMGTKAQDSLKENGKATNFAETISGDTAEVVVTFADGTDYPFDTIKVDGKWLVKLDMGK